MRLYDSVVSGNAYKVRLLCRQLGLEPEVVEVPLGGGSAPNEELLRISAEGKVPTWVGDDGFVLSESGAILCHLAQGSSLLPEDVKARALVMQWLFFEQNQVEPSIAVMNAYRRFQASEEVVQAGETILRGKAEAALGTMERWLGAGRSFFAGEAYSVADIALYAYVHQGGVSGFDLARWPEVSAWLARVEAQEGWLAMGGPEHVATVPKVGA